MSNSKYLSSYPNINPSYLSGAGNRNSNIFGFNDIVKPNNNAVKNEVQILANSNIIIFNNNNNLGIPIETSNFNVIRISIDTQKYFTDGDEEHELILEVLQGNSPDSLNVSYSTPIKVPQVFHRSYPVKNNFCNIKIKNENNIINSTLDYNISLSKFSQYTTPSQLGDVVEFKEMVSLDRSSNNFYDDVSRNLFSYSSIINRFGYFKDNLLTNQIVSPITILENLNNSYLQVYAVSDSPLDTFSFFLSGNTNNLDALNVGRIKNIIQLNGTTNSVLSINNYKYIDTIEDFNSTNVGNISIFNSNNFLLGYIPAGSSALSSPIYYINKLEEGVLKEVSIEGLVQLQNGYIDIKTNNESKITTIHTFLIFDGKIQNKWCPDFKIDSNTSVYCVARDLNTIINGNEGISISLKIIKYNLKQILS